jgi:hypothetical protein
MLDGFIESSNELGDTYVGSWSEISNLNAKKYEQKQEYEEKIKTLEAKQKELEIELEEAEEGRDANLDALDTCKH